MEGISHGGLLGAALESPRLGQSHIGSHAGRNVPERLAATHNAHQAGEEFGWGRIQHLFLRQFELLSSGRKKIALLQAIAQQCQRHPLCITRHL
jgi:hypothetical protein